ncbi:SDR family oxidoreductase [Streptomyces sp. NPDC059169]|uniref:SDR family oxidoreductase n=1 Tax=unclassified Streptomyces TaxID=2593676 RepID=UPI00368CD02E
MSQYHDKNVVITGGSSGMGLALADLLVHGGARVVVTGRSQDKLDAAGKRLGAHAVTFRGDVASLSDLNMLSDLVKTELGSIEALFVNAGISPLTPLRSTTEEMYDELFAINVKGAFFTLQRLAPLLSTNAGVVLTTSIANVIGKVDMSVYAAGKAALRSMARTFSGELLPRGIRVNAISPGPIDSGILETMNLPKEAISEFRKERIASNPMGRYGTVEEFARAAAFLAFDATYTTGIELAVDGGETQL